MRLGDEAGGRALLGELAGSVTDARPWGERAPAATLNVALSHGGLRAVGVPDAVLAAFPDEFRAGMAARAALLGDMGASAPERWQPGLRQGEADLLVTVMAQEAGALDERRDRLRALVARCGGALHEDSVQLLDHPGEGRFAREHFGFADGLCQPSIADEAAGPHGWPGRGTPAKRRRWEDVAAGEFVLGYDDEDGTVAAAPPDPLRRSGSFMVVRKLHQDVARFNAFLHDAAGGDERREELLAAKIVGRWRSGAPLELAPDADDPSLAPGGARQAEMNDFRYSSDREGLRCPLGAHIRRANPRDGLGWQGRLTKRHRIIRRGMPYGPRADPDAPDDRDRGLMFVCYQASIARQFELIQSSWLNDGDAMGVGSEKDPLVATEDPEARMTVPGRPPTFLSPLPSFVTTRGGDYFFAPGLAALRALAEGLPG